MSMFNELIGPATAVFIFAAGVFGRHTLRLIDNASLAQKEFAAEMKAFVKETQVNNKEILLSMHNITNMMRDNYVSKAEHNKDVVSPDNTLKKIHEQLQPEGVIPKTLSRIESSVQTLANRGGK